MKATAEEMGYFKEDAISSDDAIKSNYQNDDLFYSDMLKISVRQSLMMKMDQMTKY